MISLALVCETGDFFLQKREKLVKSKKGEYLVIGNAGAYGRVMAQHIMQGH